MHTFGISGSPNPKLIKLYYSFVRNRTDAGWGLTILVPILFFSSLCLPLSYMDSNFLSPIPQIPVSCIVSHSPTQFLKPVQVAQHFYCLERKKKDQFHYSISLFILNHWPRLDQNPKVAIFWFLLLLSVIGLISDFDLRGLANFYFLLCWTQITSLPLIINHSTVKSDLFSGNRILVLSEK